MDSEDSAEEWKENCNIPVKSNLCPKSCPPFLSIRQNPLSTSQPISIVTLCNTPINTKLGYLIAPLVNQPPPRPAVRLPIKYSSSTSTTTIIQDNSNNTICYYDRHDQNLCNWLMYIPFNKTHANVHCYIENGKLYFITISAIPCGKALIGYYRQDYIDEYRKYLDVGEKENERKSCDNVKSFRYEVHCHACLFTFSSHEICSAHMSLHHQHHQEEIRDHFCPSCNRLYDDEIAFIVHLIKKHIILKPIAFPQSINSYKQWKENLEINITNSDEIVFTFACIGCQRHFIHLRSLVKHKEICCLSPPLPVPTVMPESKIYKCSFCRKKFLGKKQLQLHGYLHHAQFLTQCLYCNQLYPWHEEERHSQQHAIYLPNVESKRFPCLECDKQCFTYAAILQHNIKAHYYNYKKVYIYNSKLLPTMKVKKKKSNGFKKLNLLGHGSVGGGGSSSGGGGGLFKKNHKKLKIKSHNLSIYRPKRIDLNELIITGDPLECHCCTKTFHLMQSFTLHMELVHQVMLFYPCPYCPFESDSMNYLYEHVDSIHSKWPRLVQPSLIDPNEKTKEYLEWEVFTCRLCKNQITMRENLAQHLFKQHPIWLKSLLSREDPTPLHTIWKQLFVECKIKS